MAACHLTSTLPNSHFHSAHRNLYGTLAIECTVPLLNEASSERQMIALLYVFVAYTWV